MDDWDAYAASKSLQPIFRRVETDAKEDYVSESYGHVMCIIDSVSLDASYHNYARPVLGLAIVCLQLMLSFKVL